MSNSQPHSKPGSSVDENRPDREAARPSSFMAVPGWVVSGMLHAGLIVFLVTAGLPSCGDQQIGTGAEQGAFREVGIYVKQPSDSQTPKEDPQPDVKPPQETNAAAPSAKAAPSTKESDATATDLINLPDVKPRQVIGENRSAPTPGGLPDSPEAVVQPNTAIRVPQSPGKGPGTISFMGHSSKGERVVYVIDTSGSMSGFGAITYAQSKLKESINGLSQKQQFQIIAFAINPTHLTLGQDTQQSRRMYRATGPNLLKATAFINSFRADDGTQVDPALRRAFDFHPDVIFFLSDAKIEEGYARSLDHVSRNLNANRNTKIHCIQFGDGTNLKTRKGNFLRMLAQENGGTYSYFNVTKLAH